MLDDVIYQDEHNPSSFHDQIVRIAEKKAKDKHLMLYLENKREETQEQAKNQPLESYREAELANMRVNFFGEDRSYHEARMAFVYKEKVLQTPAHLAVHRKHRLKEECELEADATN